MFLALTNGLHKMRDRNRELGKLSDAIHAEFSKRYVDDMREKAEMRKEIEAGGDDEAPSSHAP